MRVRFHPLAVPANVHPAVRRLFVEMNAQHCTAADITERSGMGHNTIGNWRTRVSPTIDNLEAALNVLGLELYVRERRG